MSCHALPLVNDDVLISDSSSGFEVIVASRQGLRDLRCEAKVDPVFGCQSGLDQRDNDCKFLLSLHLISVLNIIPQWICFYMCQHIINLNTSPLVRV